jgi:hypothetical protein
MIFDFVKQLFCGKKKRRKNKRFAAAVTQSGRTNKGTEIVTSIYAGSAVNKEEFISACISFCLENEENRWMKIHDAVCIEIDIEQ